MTNAGPVRAVIDKDLEPFEQAVHRMMRRSSVDLLPRGAFCLCGNVYMTYVMYTDACETTGSPRRPEPVGGAGACAKSVSRWTSAEVQL